MEELLKAATAFFKAGAAYYEKQANPLRSVTQEGVELEAPKARKPRATKPEAAAPQEIDVMGGQADRPGQGSAPAEKPLTDAEVKAKTEKTVETFVMRFKNANPTGVERAKNILKELGVDRMAQLDRAGNLKLTEKVELELTRETLAAGVNGAR